MSGSATFSPDSPPTKPGPLRAQRAIVWCVRIGLVLVIGLVLIGQSGVFRFLILPRIASAVGCDADAGIVTLTPTGRLAIRDLRLRAPGVHPIAATFFEAPSIIINPKWRGLLTGSLPVESVLVRGAIIRLSVDSELRMNLAGLRGGTGALLADVPSVDLVDALLDFGEHGPGGYTPLISLPVSGRLTRAAADSSRYTFELKETPLARAATAAHRPIRARGEFDLALSTGLIRLDEIDLSRWQGAQVPSVISDYWRTLAVRGDATRVEMTYTAQGGPVVAVSLRGVSLNVPVPAEREDGSPALPASPAGPLLAMRGVSGDLRFTQSGLEASLRGLIESLACEVVLKTEGYRLTSPLTCHIRTESVRVGESPRLLPFAPWVVRRNFERFSGPTAEVSGEVMLVRAASPAGEIAPLEVRGRIDFTDGTAAFEKFRYPFTRMKGRVTFDENEVRIVGVTGVGPTGASLMAQGRVAPPSEHGAVEVDVAVADVPVDEHLRSAIPGHRRPLLDALFSEERLAGLRAMPLSGPNADQLRRALDSFALGGVCSIRVAVRRDEGEHHDYRTQVTVNMPQAGIVSALAPYPLRAEKLSLRITDEEVDLTAPRLTGLTGAAARLDLRLKLAENNEHDEYDARLVASTMPCDDLLLAALPAGASDRIAMRSPRALTQALSPSGTFGGSLRVYSLPDGRGSAGYEACIDLAGLSAHVGGRGCLDIEDLAGHLILTHHDAAILDLTGRIGAGAFNADIVADGLDRDDGALISAGVAFHGLSLAAEVEHLLDIVSPSDAERLRDLRRTWAPRGEASGTLRLHAEGSAVDYLLRFDRAASPSIRALDSRLALEDASGVIEVSPRAVAAHAFSARLVFDGDDSGRIRLDGAWPLAENADSAMHLRLSSARLESPLVRRAALARVPRAARWLEDFGAAGGFDVEASLRRSASGDPAVSGEFVPAAIVLTRNSREVRFDPVAGSIRFDNSGGEVRDLHARADGWAVSLAGRWTHSPALDVDLALALDADGLPDSLVALLPAPAAKAFESVRLRITGPLTVRHARLRTDDDPSSLLFSATIGSGPAELSFGMPMRVASATAALRARFPLDGAPPTILDADLRLPAFAVAGLNMTDGRMSLCPATRPGVYEAPELSARLHNGTLFGSAAVCRTESSEDAGMEYAAELRFAGVELASLLRDLDLDVDQRDAADSAGRGRIDATVSLAGRGDRPESRRGRGLVRVSGGEIVELPGIVPLLRLSNLQPPIGEPIDSASASFHIAGDRIEFDQLLVSSRSVMVEGGGSITWPDGSLDLRFNSRGRASIPIFGDALRAMRNEIITTAVAGTVRNPEYHLEAFPAAQRMLGSIFRPSGVKRGAPATPDAPVPRGEEKP